MSGIRKNYEVSLGKIKRLWDLDSRKEAQDWINNIESKVGDRFDEHFNKTSSTYMYDNSGELIGQKQATINEIQDKINKKQNENTTSNTEGNESESLATSTGADEKGGKMAGYVGAIVAAAQNALEGAAGIAGGLIGRRQREREARLAGEDFQAQMTALRRQDVDNPFQNVQNTFEDLTVNQKEAEFLAGQQQLGMATTMSQMRRTVGSSGLAGMAQAMANQQSINLQKASASIGQQEVANQAMAAKGRFEQEKMFAMGEKEKRMMEFAKQNQLLAMASDRKIAADEAIAAQRAALIGGVGQLITGTGAFAGAMALKDK
tara:strand:- start:2496 stop:3452 length:957 start_codon:yes stop_codon:yes gene_type:complete